MGSRSLVSQAASTQMSLPTTCEEKDSIFRGTLDLEFGEKDCGFVPPISSISRNRLERGLVSAVGLLERNHSRRPVKSR